MNKARLLKLAPVTFFSVSVFQLSTALYADTVVVPHITEAVTFRSGLGEPVYLTEASGEAQPLLPMSPAIASGGGGLEFYDHGNPTDYEQLMLELVNRSRADPGAEAARLGIDLNENLAPGTIVDTPKQPLGSHRFLIDAARAHSQWMLDNDVFSHTGEGDSTASQRALAAGYPSGVGENIAWGGTSGTVDPEASTRARHDGLFISPGHRVNLCFDSYREIGLGILLGQFYSEGTNWNALMATQNFGSSNATPWPFIVGVAYYDFNENGVYDPGEGIGGIDVHIDGGGHYTTTASAGGYTLPRPSAAGIREVTMSAPFLSESVFADLPLNLNYKVDLALEYAPPSPVGPLAPAVGHPNYYAISPVPGATSFEVKRLSADPAEGDGADDLSRVVDGTSGDYSALSTSVKAAGSGAYRFAHTIPADQILEYVETFRPGSAAVLHFRSRLGWATSGQVGRVEVSSDGGVSWTAVYDQAGTGSSEEGSFQVRSVSLSAHAGQLLQIRFNYHFAGGSYYPQSSDGVGWYVDEITFEDVAMISLIEEATVAPGAHYVFEPSDAGASLLVVRPQNLDRWWPTGLPVEVEAEVGLSYETWAHNWEIAGDLAMGSLIGTPTEDPGNRGIPNIVAYALGLNPLIDSVGDLPGWVQTDAGIVFEYTVETAATGATVVPEISTDLTNWHPVGAAALGFNSEDQLHSAQGSVQTRRIILPSATPSAAFFRVRVAFP